MVSRTSGAAIRSLNRSSSRDKAVFTASSIPRLSSALAARPFSLIRRRVQMIQQHWQEPVAVRDAKGHKDRLTILPKTIVEPLEKHLAVVKRRHAQAMEDGYGGVELPYALARK